ncbi:2Fe-2S iron-sulfur cluster-binding protein [Streptacidiphilus monticola]|uniref:2Fe-2S iron-sulfur cluster-binding protein n=1 Tax=Streptacidiphilus monticola TaxID=2161674 RepID=A0ABW1G7L8_9ACTN
MDAVLTVRPDARLERFHPSTVHAAGEEVTVELRRSGKRLTVPADRTVLEAVREELPDVAYSCEQGFCGTCRVRVLAGVPDHRDEILTEREREHSMLICVSRARDGELTLDL